MAKKVQILPGNKEAYIDMLRKREAKAEKELKTIQNEIASYVSGWQLKIANGTTTGDPVRDLVIQAHGVDDSLTGVYRALQERLAGKVGEFVMIRYHARVRTRYGSRLTENDYRNETHFRIGVLAGEELRLADTKNLMVTSPITLPVDQYVGGVWPRFGHYPPVLKDAPVCKDFFIRRSTEDKPPTLLAYLQELHMVDGLTIGDMAVRTELATIKIKDDKLFAAAAEKLGRLVLEPTEG